MIQVTRLNGSQVYVNAELIRFVEATPDTVLSLTTGERVVVHETPEEVVADVIAYRRQILGRRPAAGWSGCSPADGADGASASPDSGTTGSAPCGA